MPLKPERVVGAELLQWDDKVGSIEAGKLADIIAVKGNPLADISKLERPVFVMKNGKIIINKLDNYSALTPLHQPSE